MEIIQEITNTKLCCRISKVSTGISKFHWHKNYEICQVIKNSCRFLVDGQLIEAAEGDLVIISEHSVHRFLGDTNDTLVRIMQFPLKTLLDANIAIVPLSPHISRKEMSTFPDLEENINILFSLLEKECPVTTDCDNPFLQSITAALYSLLSRHFSSDVTNINCTERQEFYRIVEYINAHFTENINIKTLSEILFIARGPLSSLFVKYAGISLNEYIHSLRIKNAILLLQQGHSVTEAALESGFQNIRTFNNVYKKMIGSAPTHSAKRSIPYSDSLF